MRVIVPFDGETPKTRLGPALNQRERRQFARAMLNDVLRGIRGAGGNPLVLAPAPFDLPQTRVCVDDRSLSTAVNAQIQSGSMETAVVMADLPLVTPEALERLFEKPGDVVLAYGTGGGTNALVSRHPRFRVDYHDGSYQDHLAIAEGIDATVSEVDSYGLAHDIDEPCDLADLLIRGDGTAADWLRHHGFTVDETSDRGDIQRTDAPLPGRGRSD